MNTYILFRNQGYAEVLAKKLGLAVDDTVQKSEEDLYRITPENNDLIIVDAHYKGSMQNCRGLEIVATLQNIYSNWNKKAIFKIVSWFPQKDFDEKPDLNFLKSNLRSLQKVDQLPEVDFN